MKKYFVLLIIIFGGLLMGCKKETQYYKVGDDIKEWFEYQVGSYFIMKDSLSGALDSFFYIGRSHSQYSGDKKKQYENYSIIIDQYSYLSKSIVSGLGISLTADAYQNNSNLYYSYKYPTSDNLIIYPLLSIPFKPTGSWPDGVNMNVESIPYINIDGNIYTDVYHFSYSSTTKKCNDEIFLNLKCGIIKLVQDNDFSKRTLILEKLNIIK